MGTTQAHRHSMFLMGQWKAATACGPNGGNCVEVSRVLDEHICVRDSKRRDGSTLVFPTANWLKFIDANKPAVALRTPVD
ncbi:hypothetical protein H4W33_006357 [Kibdelosporangium phytohabitans]|nr:hypothetical protein [Kibdelosporangium phytohabitans]